MKGANAHWTLCDQINWLAMWLDPSQLRMPSAVGTLLKNNLPGKLKGHLAWPLTTSEFRFLTKIVKMNQSCRCFLFTWRMMFINQKNPTKYTARVGRIVIIRVLIVPGVHADSRGLDVIIQIIDRDKTPMWLPCKFLRQNSDIEWILQCQGDSLNVWRGIDIESQNFCFNLHLTVGKSRYCKTTITAQVVLHATSAMYFNPPLWSDFFNQLFCFLCIEVRAGCPQGEAGQ